MTNTSAALGFDPATAGRSGRALREVPEAERPRERLALRGPGGLSAAELIALIWGAGFRGANAVDLAEAVLSRHDGISGGNRGDR